MDGTLPPVEPPPTPPTVRKQQTSLSSFFSSMTRTAFTNKAEMVLKDVKKDPHIVKPKVTSDVNQRVCQYSLSQKHTLEKLSVTQCKIS